MDGKTTSERRAAAFAKIKVAIAKVTLTVRHKRPRDVNLAACARELRGIEYSATTTRTTKTYNNKTSREIVILCDEGKMKFHSAPVCARNNNVIDHPQTVCIVYTMNCYTIWSNVYNRSRMQISNNFVIRDRFGINERRAHDDERE